MFFLIFCHADVRRSVQTITDPDPGGPKTFRIRNTATMLQSAIWKRQCYLVGTRRRLQNAAKFSGGDHGLDLLLLVGGKGRGMISWLGGAQLFPDGWAPGADDLWHVLHCKPASHLAKQHAHSFLESFLKQCCGSGIFLSRIRIFQSTIPDPESKRFRIPDPDQRISIFNTKIAFKLSDIWSGMFIPDPDLVFLLIPDPASRGKKGTGSRIRNTVQKDRK